MGIFSNILLCSFVEFVSNNFTIILGVVLVQKGEMKEALHHFRETLKLRPNLVVARDYIKFALATSA